MSDAPGVRRVAGPSRSLLGAVERRLGLTPSGLAVAGLAAAGWLAAYAIGSRVMYLMVYAAAGLLVALALAGRRSLGITARRSEVPVRIREGTAVDVEVEIGATRRLGGIVLEESLERIREPVRLLVPSIASGETVAHRYQIRPRRRGVFSIGPLTAVWSDPFGLTRRRSELLPAAEVIVHPHTERVRDRVVSREWEDPPVRPPVSKPWPTGFEFYGMRDYVSGDDPRRIVWRAVARTGRYLVREAEQGITDRVTILVDTAASRHTPGDPSDTLEEAVRAVASLGRLHLHEGFVVTLDTPEARLVSGLRGRRALVRLLDEAARLAPGSAPLVDGVRRLVADPRRGTHDIVVATTLDHGSAALLRVLLGRGSSVTYVHVPIPDADDDSARRAAALGCEVVELRPGVSLEAVFKRSLGAGIRR